MQQKQYQQELNQKKRITPHLQTTSLPAYSLPVKRLQLANTSKLANNSEKLKITSKKTQLNYTFYSSLTNHIITTSITEQVKYKNK